MIVIFKDFVFRVLVIVFNYNYVFYFCKCLDLVYSQIYIDFEVILLDDCFSDNSRDILVFYKEEKFNIIFVFNEFNSGLVFCQWEKGVFLVCGEYIWIVEFDDFVFFDFLKQLVIVMDEYLEVGLVYF